MNWITTNIRFPEDLYMELKMEAASRRISLAALVRERIIHTLLKEKRRLYKGRNKNLTEYGKIRKS